MVNDDAKIHYIIHVCKKISKKHNIGIKKYNKSKLMRNYRIIFSKPFGKVLAYSNSLLNYANSMPRA